MTEREYDLVVVGGGIFGVSLAWEAASRGLTAALLERDDFCGATSANSFRIVHGGMRYLQHGDLSRIRESCAERSSLLRIAPHLVRPLPIVVPLSRGLMRGKTAMRAALTIYDLLTWDRNRGIRDPLNRIPRGRIVSRSECRALFPELDDRGLTGAAIFHDGQMYNPTRLALSFLRSATEAGADAVNYAEVTRFLRSGDRVIGVAARDRLSGEEFDVRGKMVINAAGPWAERLLGSLDVRLDPRPTFSRDACFLIPRKLVGTHALAVQGATNDPDALMSRGARHLFVVPWRDYTLIGVWHVVYDGPPDSFSVTEAELGSFLDEINSAVPSLRLSLDDISLWNAGLVLFGENKPGARNLSYGKRSWIIDHARTDRLPGLITVIGVRYTTARGVAAQTVDLALQRMDRRASPSRTATTPIYGGAYESFDALLREATSGPEARLPEELALPLVRNYGSRYGDVVNYGTDDRSLMEPVGTSTTLRAEVLHGLREEMAVKLGDVVFRRTELGTGAYPGDASLELCAGIMAAELGWDSGRVQAEIREVQSRFLHRPAGVSPS